MIRAFFDEATDDKNIFLMAGWLGRFEEWEEFSNAWSRELKFEPSIKYFNHNEAMGLKGQFSGWLAETRDAKIMCLASVVARFDSLIGIVGQVKVPEHSRLFAGSIVPKRTLRSAIKMVEPYHVACECVIAWTIGYQVVIAKNLTDQVDFIFDDGVPYLDDCIAHIPRLKSFLPQQSLPIFGTVLPGNDKSIVALQASDLLAGQELLKFRIKDLPEPLGRMGNYRIHRKVCPLEPLKGVPKSIARANLVWVSRMLEKMKKRGLRERERED